MGTRAAVLHSRPYAAAAPLRALQAWHLYSLDAPTVALCWLLLFAQSMHVPHPWPAAAALSGAVWLVYAADRLLDARREPATVWAPTPHATLSHLYREHATTFLIAAVPVCAGVAALLAALPTALMEAWLLLAIPLTLYAAVVHLLHLPGRWKAVCVGIFFAVAVALPALVHRSGPWPVAWAALAFGGVCRANCAVLRANARRLRVVLALAAVCTLPAILFGETRAIATACVAALGLLLVLVHRRDEVCERMGWLAWRALVDAALVAPPLLVSAFRLTR